MKRSFSKSLLEKVKKENRLNSDEINIYILSLNQTESFIINQYKRIFGKIPLSSKMFYKHIEIIKSILGFSQYFFNEYYNLKTQTKQEFNKKPMEKNKTYEEYLIPILLKTTIEKNKLSYFRKIITEQNNLLQCDIISIDYVLKNISENKIESINPTIKGRIQNRGFNFIFESNINESTNYITLSDLVLNYAKTFSVLSFIIKQIVDINVKDKSTSSNDFYCTEIERIEQFLDIKIDMQLIQENFTGMFDKYKGNVYKDKRKNTKYLNTFNSNEWINSYIGIDFYITALQYAVNEAIFNKYDKKNYKRAVKSYLDKLDNHFKEKNKDLYTDICNWIENKKTKQGINLIYDSIFTNENELFFKVSESKENNAYIFKTIKDNTFPKESFFTQNKK